jgi:hypothetical protein
MIYVLERVEHPERSSCIQCYTFVCRNEYGFKPLAMGPDSEMTDPLNQNLTRKKRVVSVELSSYSIITT